MSIGAHSAARWIGQPHRRKEHLRAHESLSAQLTGAAALAAAVGAALWIAGGATQGNYLLELPSGLPRPGWAKGPLRAFGALLGPLGPTTLSVALVVLLVAYLIGLARADSISLRLAIAAVVLGNLAFTLGPSIVSSDAFGYIAYAREAAHGLNPYTSAPAALGHDGILQFVYWKHQTSPYGPLFTGLGTALGLLPSAAAFWVYKALAGIASVAIALVVAELARRRGQCAARAAIFVGLNPVLLFYAVSGAHNDLLAELFVVGAFALVLHGRDGRGAALAVCAAAIKLTLGLALPFVLVGARRRAIALVGAALAAVAIGIPTLLLTGPHLFDQLHRIVSDPRFDIAFSGPDRLAEVLGTPINGLVRGLCTVLAGAVALVMGIRALRGADVFTAAGWAMLALLGSIASLAPWYLVWLLPVAAIGRSRALWFAAILATLWLLAVHLPVLGAQPWLSGSAGGLAFPRGGA